MRREDAGAPRKSGRPGIGDARIDEARTGVDAPHLGRESEQDGGGEDRENDQVHLGHLRDLVQFTRPIGSYLD